MIPSQTLFTRPLIQELKNFFDTVYTFDTLDKTGIRTFLVDEDDIKRVSDTSDLPDAEAMLFIIHTSSFLCKSPFFSDPLSSSRVSPMDPVILLSLDCTMLQLSVWIWACSYVAPLSGQCSIWGARCLGTGLWATGEPGQGQGSLMHPEYYTDNCRRSRKANGGGYNYISPF